MKKILLFLALATPSLTVLAAEGTVDGIVYATDGNEAYVKGTKLVVEEDELISVVIPSTVTIANTSYPVTAIAEYAFEKCANIQYLTIPASVRSIGNGAFWDCVNLESLSIPKGVTSIGESTFYGCQNLKNVDIPSSVTSIGDYAFIFCESLPSISIPSAVTDLGIYSFWGCKALKEFAFPDAISTVGECMFYCCESLESVDFPSSLTSIEWSAFRSCSSLRSLYLPSSLTSIADNAFYLCTSLEMVACNAVTPPALGEDVFPINPNIEYAVPDSYKKDKSWNQYMFGKTDQPDMGNNMSGIIEIDLDMPYQVYDLRGRMVNSSTEDLPSGLYIIRQGDHTAKIIK